MLFRHKIAVTLCLLMTAGIANAQTATDPATLAKAQAGDAQAQYTVGDLYFSNNDSAHAADAFAWMQKAAAQNLPVATGGLGMFYVVGFGTSADPEKGRALLEQANATGDDLAATNLAVFYVTGNGATFPQDRQKAISYLQRPVADHNVSGEFDLGFLLSQSDNAADQQKAMVLWQAAASAGNIMAASGLGNIYNNGNHVVQPSRAKAESYYKIAADAGDISAMAALGVDLVHDGDPNGGPHDTEAATWLSKAAAAGNADAQNYYGYLLQNGRGVTEDDAAAVKWDAAAAAQNNIPATRRLGYLTANGIGTKEDDAKAASLYRTAAAAGDPRAMTLLGETLLGGNADANKQAAALFAKAAAAGDAGKTPRRRSRDAARSRVSGGRTFYRSPKGIHTRLEMGPGQFCHRHDRFPGAGAKADQ
jgi:TPR repeat protein